MERVKVLTGERVSLVIPEKQDIDLWYKGMNNIELTKNIPIVFGKNWYKEEEEYFYDRIKSDKNSINFCIYLKEEKKVIGNIALNKINKLSRNADFGIIIFEEDELNKGYGTEAIKLLLKYAFEILGLHKVNGAYVDFNKRGERVYEKLGFKKSGILKEQHYIMGKYYDDILIEIFRDEFTKKQTL